MAKAPVSASRSRASPYIPDMKSSQDTPPPPVAIDLYCGAGGLSYGMQRAGIRIIGGIDIDPACRHPFATNVKAKFYERDISNLSVQFIESIFPRRGVRVLAGCAPCQPFSSYTRGRNDQQDQWQLLDKFGEIVSELKPEIVTMENVPRLIKHSVFERFLSVLDKAGYDRSHRIVRCAEYGVPQTRSRLVLLASTLGGIELVPTTHAEEEFVTVRETIHHLCGIDAGGSAISDSLHTSSRLSPMNMDRIRKSKPGGTWRDWDDALRTACHARASGRSYPSVYGRMEWDRLGPTITTQFHGYGNGRFGHPDQDRAISLREGALLQTFPEDYSFIPPRDPAHIGPVARLIGNAVPVRLGEAIGNSILKHVETFL